MADNNFPPGQGGTPDEPEESVATPRPEAPSDALGNYPAPGMTPAPPAAMPPAPATPAVPVAPGAPVSGTESTPQAPSHPTPSVQPGGYPTAAPASHPTTQGTPAPSAAAHEPQQLTQEYPTQSLPESLGKQGFGQQGTAGVQTETPAAGQASAFGAAQASAQGAGNGSGGGSGPGGHDGPSKAQPNGSKRGHSTGTFLAGLAVAALIGGIVGGGVSSLVVANSQPKAGAVSQQGGAVKLNNPDSATEISGVAMVGTPSVVTLSVESQTEAGSGSGVIYSEDGYIITNAHVVTLDGAASDPRIRVKHSDGRVFDGTLVGVAPYSDIAVVKVEAEGLTPIEVADSSKVNVGDLAVAIGAPMSLSNTVTSGVVSALNRGISVGSALIPKDPTQEGQEDPRGEGEPDGGGRGFPWDFRFDTPGESQNTQQAGGQVTLPVVQTDASINPGNSGGALLNANAELIGINVAIASPGATEGNASSAGLGFAIPADLATRVADEIIAGEKPSHGLLGASVVDSSLDTDADANHAGGLIKEIVRGGAAAKAGLKIGDVITAVDGVPAADGTSVSALIRMHAGDSEVVIDYTRAGVAGQVTATLGTLDW